MEYVYIVLLYFNAFFTMDSEPVCVRTYVCVVEVTGVAHTVVVLSVAVFEVECACVSWCFMVI